MARINCFILDNYLLKKLFFADRINSVSKFLICLNIFSIAYVEVAASLCVFC